MSRLGCRAVCQSEEASCSYALLPGLDDDDGDDDGFESALASPKIASHDRSGNLMDTFHAEGCWRRNFKEEIILKK